MTWAIMPETKETVACRLHLETGACYGIKRAENEWRVWHNANGDLGVWKCDSEDAARALIARLDAAVGLGAPDVRLGDASIAETEQRERAERAERERDAARDEKAVLVNELTFTRTECERLAKALDVARPESNDVGTRVNDWRVIHAALDATGVPSFHEEKARMLTASERVAALAKARDAERARAEKAEAELARESGHCRTWMTRAEKAECERLVACDDARIRIEKAEAERDAARAGCERAERERNDDREKCQAWADRALKTASELEESRADLQREREAREELLRSLDTCRTDYRQLFDRLAATEDRLSIATQAAYDGYTSSCEARTELERVRASFRRERPLSEIDATKEQERSDDT